MQGQLVHGSVSAMHSQERNSFWTVAHLSLPRPLSFLSIVLLVSFSPSANREPIAHVQNHADLRKLIDGGVIKRTSEIVAISDDVSVVYHAGR